MADINQLRIDKLFDFIQTTFTEAEIEKLDFDDGTVTMELNLK